MYLPLYFYSIIFKISFRWNHILNSYMLYIYPNSIKYILLHIIYRSVLNIHIYDESCQRRFILFLFIKTSYAFYILYIFILGIL